MSKTQHKCPQDRDIWYAALGKPSNPIKVMMTCGVHARELITSDTCLSIINSVVKDKDEYEDLYLVVMPIVNKNREKVLKGETCLRVNERGVDPNRNFPTEFELGVEYLLYRIIGMGAKLIMAQIPLANAPANA